MVAETVSAAIALTEQAFPSVTPTLVLESTPTQTAIPEISLVGSVLAIQDDGSTFFADQRAGYEMTIPAGWLAVRVNEQEYLDAFILAETANEHIQKSLASIKNQDPNKFRLFSVDVREGHVQNEIVTNINIFWEEQVAISLDTDTELKASAAQAVEAVPGLEILSTKISSTTNAVPYGLIESKLPARNSSGVDVLLFQKQFLFNAKTGTMIITLSTVDGLKDMIFPEFDAMLETIRITE
jgi:hypothetical protein